MNSSEQTEPRAKLPLPESLEAAARKAFAKHVWLFDEQDQIIVHVEPHQLRLVYVSVRASRQSSLATFIQCRVDDGGEQMWISTVKASADLRRQGLSRKMVEAAEATARAIGVSMVKVYPLLDTVGFWRSLGYASTSSSSGVLQKQL
jgi:GNAT superfamily N-acetyltransferase